MTMLTINIPVPDQLKRYFAERDMMVTPINDHEAGQFAVALHELEKFVGMVARHLEAVSTVHGGD